MTKRVTVTDCPNCGAPITSRDFDDSSTPTCAFCQTVLPTVSDPPAAPAQPDFKFTPFTPSYGGSFGGVGTTGLAMRPRRAKALVWLILMGTLLIVGLSVGLPIALKHVSSSIFGDYQVQGIVVPAASDVTSRDAYVIAPPIATLDSPVLRKVDLHTGQILWSTASLNGGANVDPVVLANGSTAVVIAGTDVYGFSATTGIQLWRASIGYAPVTPSACMNKSGCALLIGPDMVVLEGNGTLQSLLVKSGKQLWSRKFSDEPTFLEKAGGMAAVVATAKGSSDDLFLFNPANGAQKNIAPSCASDGQGDLATAGTSSYYDISPDGTTLTVLIDGSGGCVASYRISDGKLLWRTAPDSENSKIPFILNDGGVTSGSGLIAWTNDDQDSTLIFAVNTKTGAIKGLINAGKQGNTTTLDGIVNGTLVLEQAPSYASDQPAIYGVSVTTGKQLWNDASRVNPAFDWSNQYVAVAPDGLVIASCSSTGGQEGSCRIETANPQTGKIIATHNLAPLVQLPTIDGITTLPNEVLFNVNSAKAVGIVANSGDLAGQWP